MCNMRWHRYKMSKLFYCLIISFTRVIISSFTRIYTICRKWHITDYYYSSNLSYKLMELFDDVHKRDVYCNTNCVLIVIRNSRENSFSTPGIWSVWSLFLLWFHCKSRYFLGFFLFRIITDRQNIPPNCSKP